jgi:hypothetical protein
VHVIGVDDVVAGVPPFWVSVNVTWPAAWQLKVAWIVMTSVATPLVSALVVTVFVPLTKPGTVRPAAPLAVADVKPPVPVAVRVAGAPAGEFVYVAMTLKAPAPDAVAVTLVVLPAAGVAMTPIPPTSANRAAMKTRGFTERMKSPPSTRLLFPAVAIKG